MKNIFAFVFFMCLFSCTKQNADRTDQGVIDEETPESPAPSSPKELIPLKLGNEWVYENKFYRPDGTIYDSSTNIVFITQKKIINGKEFFGAGDYFLRNVDSVTIERYSSDSMFIYFKKVKSNEVLSSYQFDRFGDGCLSTHSYTAFAELKNIFGYDCYLNEDKEILCDNAPAQIQFIYLKPGLGYVGFVSYGRTFDGVSYKDSEQKLISYILK